MWIAIFRFSFKRLFMYDIFVNTRSMHWCFGKLLRKTMFRFNIGREVIANEIIKAMQMT